MNITINAQAVEIPAHLNVTELLKVQQVKMPDMVSVELNGEILKREDFAGTLLQEGDRVEFLYFMGGGAPGRSGR